MDTWEGICTCNVIALSIYHNKLHPLTRQLVTHKPMCSLMSLLYRLLIKVLWGMWIGEACKHRTYLDSSPHGSSFICYYKLYGYCCNHVFQYLICLISGKVCELEKLILKWFLMTIFWNRGTPWKRISNMQVLVATMAFILIWSLSLSLFPPSLSSSIFIYSCDLVQKAATYRTHLILHSYGGKRFLPENCEEECWIW